MIRIETRPVKAIATIDVPGSKSYTHRLLMAAALSDGACRIANPLRSEDTHWTAQALRQMGVVIEERASEIHVSGIGGHFSATDQPIYLGNSGTSMRLLGGLTVLGQGEYLLTGSARMCQRPIQPLLDALRQMGVPAVAVNGDGCPPVRISGGHRRGGHSVDIDCSVSSQYLTALLMIAPCLDQGLTLSVSRGPVSKPYIDMTVDILDAFGIRVARDGYTHFAISGGQRYTAGNYRVESDASQAGYFWAAAAVTGATVKVRGVSRSSRQGDVGLADVLGRMGCRVTHEPDGIAVTGGALTAVCVDMGHMPDMVPTLAVVAAFAGGTTVIANVAHLRAKESDRLAAVVRGLGKMGIAAESTADELRICGGHPGGARIDTYDDHRIAMSFAVAGLRVPGVWIADETCVQKSFPDFWEVFSGLYR
jgi:3-phosphoshikimate 1-carboxyvinyltransferase